MYPRYLILSKKAGKTTSQQLKKYRETTFLHPLKPEYLSIEIMKKTKYRVVGKMVEKEKRY